MLERRLGLPREKREHLSLAHYYWAVANRAVDGSQWDIGLMFKQRYQFERMECPRAIWACYSLAMD